MNLKAVLASALSIYLSLFSLSAQAQTICSSGSGIHDGYNYELWNDNDQGSACMTLKDGGAFSCEWSDIENVMFRKGKRFDGIPYREIGSISVNYGAIFDPDGNAYLGIYGWLFNPRAEFYILDSWGTWRPPGSGYMGTITVDGSTYDVYRTTYPMGIDPAKRYWSIRTSKRTSGTISVSEHFKAWESLEMTVGDVYEVTMLVEGYLSNGSADIYSMSIDVINDNDYTEITIPFAQDGAGSFKWKTSSIPTCILSWNLDSLTVNGVDITNIWIPALYLPDKQNGYYYIDCQSSYSWSHVEIK